MLKKKSEILGGAFSNGTTFSKLARKYEVFSHVRLLLFPYKNTQRHILQIEITSQILSCYMAVNQLLEAVML